MLNNPEAVKARGQVIALIYKDVSENVILDGWVSIMLELERDIMQQKKLVLFKGESKAELISGV